MCGVPQAPLPQPPAWIMSCASRWTPWLNSAGACHSVAAWGTVSGRTCSPWQNSKGHGAQACGQRFSSPWVGGRGWDSSCVVRRETGARLELYSAGLRPDTRSRPAPAAPDLSRANGQSARYARGRERKSGRRPAENFLIRREAAAVIRHSLAPWGAVQTAHRAYAVPTVLTRQVPESVRRNT